MSEEVEFYFILSHENILGDLWKVIRERVSRGRGVFV